MPDGYLTAEGQIVSIAGLQIPKAREVAEVLQDGIRWATFVECRRLEARVSSDGKPQEDVEVIVFDVEVQVGQRPKNPIHRHERIAVRFEASDENCPKTLALRADFPVVPHLNFELFELPRSLCLFDVPYSELKVRWTAASYIERVRTWLHQTSEGTLHAESQPLEQLLIGLSVPFILPADFCTTNGKSCEMLAVQAIDADPNRRVLVGKRIEEVTPGEHFGWAALVVESKPQTHGSMRLQPVTLHQLHNFLLSGDVDLLKLLRQRLSRWRRQGIHFTSPLIILVVLPKTRFDGGPIESVERWGFLCMPSIDEHDRLQGKGEAVFEPLSSGEVLERIGVLKTIIGKPGTIKYPHHLKTGKSVALGLLNPICLLTRNQAALQNGLPQAVDTRITAIGMGALGSQLVMNLVRAGYGIWNVIDDDYLLPHNVARHTLHGPMIGWPKVKPMAHLANSLYDDPSIMTPITANVLKPGNSSGKVASSLMNCDVILDCSASLAVARHLTQEVQAKARRISLFLNPSGSDLVMLAEDAKREIPLDALEMQYYRFLINESALSSHLRIDGTAHRYGFSCRDVSSAMSQDLVALHAATASRAFRNTSENREAAIAIWQSFDDGSVISHQFAPSAISRARIGDWELHTDEGFLYKVHDMRRSRLPKETGGVLIGTYDMQRKIVYVVDTLPAPPDSVETKKSFERGFCGLQERMEEISQLTQDNLFYIGEWHSHPESYDSTHSEVDRQLFQWLDEKIRNGGVPPLMLIAGQNEYSWHLGKIESKATWKFDEH